MILAGEGGFDKSVYACRIRIGTAVRGQVRQGSAFTQAYTSGLLIRKSEYEDTVLGIGSSGSPCGLLEMQGALFDGYSHVLWNQRELAPIRFSLFQECTATFLGFVKHIIQCGAVTGQLLNAGFAVEFCVEAHLYHAKGKR